MSHVKENISHFPCDYVIKIEGKNRREFEPKVYEIVTQHAGKLSAHQIVLKQKGRMLSLTIRIVATSRKQLNAMNQDLTNCSAVDFIL
jgi:putative lipoic acid-binding regulatory protein